MYPFDTPGVINYPFPNIGEGYGICVSPYTHTSRGYATTSERDQDRMVTRLVKKITDNLHLLTKVQEEMMEDAEFAIMAYGGDSRPALEAARRAREAGIRMGFLRPIILWPFPDEPIFKVASKVTKILVVELNRDGQLVREVARASKGRAEVYHLGSGGVEPHLPDVVYQEIKKLVE